MSDDTGNTGAGDSTPAATPSVAERLGADSKMVSVIKAMTGGAVLGSSDVGASWCLKALHPAEPNVQSSPCPMQETKSFASVAYNQMNLIKMPTSFDASLPWDLTVYTFSDIYTLCSYEARQGSQAVTGYFRNSQVVGHDNVTKICEKFRLTSRSNTMYFDAASLSDQGHVISGQFEMEVSKCGNTFMPPPEQTIACTIPYGYYQEGPPTMDKVMSTSQSYQGRAADGCYVVMKMSEMGKWVSTNRNIYLLGSAMPTGMLRHLGVSDAYSQVASVEATYMETSWPFLRVGGMPGIYTPTIEFEDTYKSMAVTFFTGLSSTSSVRVVNRMTCDMVVNPGTSYAPFVRRPPEEDKLALEMYFRVSREMQDSYPSDHNNLGALLKVVGGIASRVMPLVVPKIGGYITNKVQMARTKGKSSWAELFASENRLTADDRQFLRDYYEASIAGRAISADAQARYEALKKQTLEESVDAGTLPRILGRTVSGIKSYREPRVYARSSYSRHSYHRRSSRRSSGYSSRRRSYDDDRYRKRRRY